MPFCIVLNTCAEYIVCSYHWWPFLKVSFSHWLFWALLFPYFCIWVIAYYCWGWIVRIMSENVEGKIYKLHLLESYSSSSLYDYSIMPRLVIHLTHRAGAFEKEMLSWIFLLSWLKLLCDVLQKTIFLWTFLKSPVNQRRPQLDSFISLFY